MLPLPKPVIDVETPMLADSPKELECMIGANESSVHLMRWLEQLPPLPGDAADTDTKHAVGLISALAFRTSRACLLAIAGGYEHEGIPAKRRLSEAVFRVHKILNDWTGNHARKWLAGETGESNRMASATGYGAAWDMYSHGAHVDVRLAPSITAVRTMWGDRTMFPLTGSRDRRLANHMLAELTLELRELSFIVATKLLGRDKRTAYSELLPIDEAFEVDGIDWYYDDEPFDWKCGKGVRLIPYDPDREFSWEDGD